MQKGINIKSKLIHDLTKGKWLMSSENFGKLIAAYSIADFSIDEESGKLKPRAIQTSTLPMSKDKSVGIINITGTLWKFENFFTKYYGDTSYWAIMAAMEAFNQDDTIAGVVLRFNTPGGTVEGIEEVSNYIFNFPKPTVAFVDESAFSAGEWLSSQCNTVVMNGELSEVGSIGVITYHFDITKFEEMNGFLTTYITSDGADDKYLMAMEHTMSAEDIQKVKDSLNYIAGVFKQHIKRGRRGKAMQSSVLESAATYYTQEAISNGLADSKGTINDAIKQVNQLYKNKSVKITAHELERVPIVG